MELSLTWLLASFGGGAFGAAIAGQNAFIMTGVVYLAGLGGMIGGLDTTGFMQTVVFGPVFGPHIAFAGGAAGAAYAFKKGYIETGRDIITPLAGLNKSDVLVVGGLTGMAGYVINQLMIWLLPVFKVSDPLLNYEGEVLGGTDTVAFTIIILAIIGRLVWGKTPVFGKKLPLMAVGEGKHWVAHQEKWSVTAAHGLTSGLLSAFATIALLVHYYEVVPEIAGWAQLIGWAISAVTLFFLSCGLPTPVTHHMTIVASIAALKFAPILGHASTPNEWSTTTTFLAVLIGGIAGLLAGLLGEVLSRATCAEGDTHIDPPAFAIFTSTTIIYALVALVN